jgi:hypothetical protein
MRKIFLLIATTFIIYSCAHRVHIVQANDFDNNKKTQKKIITAQSEQFVFLWFVTQTDYVEQALDKLKLQCMNKEIQGITTKYSTSLGFLS